MAALVSLAVGESIDAAIIAAIVLANAALGYAQEARAEGAARALRSVLAPSAVVVRGGLARRLDAEQLVPGDLLAVAAGDRVAADARLVEAVALEADESSLTGESLPVGKRAEPAAAATAPLAERPTMLFAGTILTRGTGRALVTATGTGSELGRIVLRTAVASPPPTPLQRRIAGFSGLLLRAAGVVCLAFAGLAWIEGEGLLESIRIGVALAVAAVPEGLPVVLTVALAVGVERMARRGAIVRHLQAVEALGSATVVCADKTGTLTEGRMRLDRVWIAGDRQTVDLDGEADPDGDRRAASVIAAAAVASQPSTGPLAAVTDATTSLTEIAIGAAARRAGAGPEAAAGEAAAAVEVEPFDARRRRMTVVVEEPSGDRAAYAKGAPEALLPLIGDGEARDALRVVAERWAGEGTRVLLVACRRGVRAARDIERGLEPVGLLGFRDPPRRGAAASVSEARRAGVRTVMITGDHPGTALAIAHATAIVPPGDAARVLAGPELDRLDAEALRERVAEVSVYARVTPEHKVRIVESLRERGEVIAMTGDGVNDVPAIRSADIGIAMGQRGTDAARAAADVVLTDDDYSTIVRAIRRGRGIYDNVLNFVHFLLAANAGEILVFALAIAAGLSAPLTVVQILLVNLLTDGLPAVAVGLDRPARDVMARRPRPPDEDLLDPIRVQLLLGGAATGLAAFASFLIGQSTGHALGQTMAFTTLVFAQLAYVYAVRARGWPPRGGRNPALHAAVALSAGVWAAVLAIPAIAERFGVVAMSAESLCAALVLALIPFTVLTAFKLTRAARRGERTGTGGERSATELAS